MTASFKDQENSLDEVVADSSDEAIKFWLEANAGNEVEFDDNLCECATWIVGERRCSCGSRRMYADYMELGDNLYLIYPQAD